MKLLSRPCKLCSTGTTPLFGATKIKLMTTEGVETLRICDHCAVTLESIRLLKEGKQLPDEKLKEKDDGGSI